ncbi:hypothetical protein BH10CYA1_BH10CYA1_28330 [soil metagenome]
MTEKLKVSAPPVSLVAKSNAEEASAQIAPIEQPSDPATNPEEQVGIDSDTPSNPRKQIAPATNEKSADRRPSDKPSHNHSIYKVPIIVLTGVCALVGLYAFTKPANFIPSTSGSSVPTVNRSKTIEDYVDQAIVAYSTKSENQDTADAWQKAFDRGAFLKLPGPAIAKLYMRAGDTISGTPKDDLLQPPPGITPKDRALADYYYSKALAIYIAEKLPRQELSTRYRLATLSYNFTDETELDNLRAIVSLEKEQAADPSERLVRAYYSLGKLLDEQGDFDEAAMYLEKAIRHDKSRTPITTSSAYSTLSRILRTKHHYSQLIRLLKDLEAKRINGYDYEGSPADFLVELKLAYLSSGDLDASEKVQAKIKLILAPPPLSGAIFTSKPIK